MSDPIICLNTVGGRRGLQIVSVALGAMLTPTLTTAQAGAVVDGRVVGADGGPAIQNAIVQLEGRRPTLTAAGGVFRFEGVELGEYQIQVEAFGYVPTIRTVVVDKDASLTIALDIAPFQMDSLVVSPREIDLEGWVRDEVRDVSLENADVLTSRGNTTRTNRRGRFDIDVWEGFPVLVRLRAFGYLPLDTILVPEKDETHRFGLAADSLVERMIDVEIKRLEERAGGQRAILMRPMNREALLGWRDYTLRDLIDTEYPLWGKRIRCVVLDERALSPRLAQGLLLTTLAREVERIEFLFRGGMMRVYTRQFMRTMLGSGLELRRPTYVAQANPPLCT